MDEQRRGHGAVGQGGQPPPPEPAPLPAEKKVFRLVERNRPDVENDFAAWATVAARLLKRSPEERAQILRELRVREPVWQRANQYWTAVLAQDVSAERTERPERFRKICAEQMRQRQAASEPTPAAAATSTGEFRKLPRTQQMAAVPAEGSPAAEDFRQRLVTPLVPAAATEGAAATERDDAAAPSAPPEDLSPVEAQHLGPAKDFVANLAPRDLSPKPPMPGQQVTADKDMKPVVQMLDRARSALDWPVEKYAKFCAELHGYPDKSELVAAQYGLRGQVVIDFVLKSWNERLEKDEALKQKWRELVAVYTEDIERRRGL